MESQVTHLSDHCHKNTETGDQKSDSVHSLQVDLPEFILY